MNKDQTTAGGGGTVFKWREQHIQRLWGKSMDGTAKRSSWNIYKQGEEEVEEGAVDDESESDHVAL